jgi:predicted O-methyltransferase YrrM
VPLLKRSGLVIVDNLFPDSAATTAIREFNKIFVNHPLLDATIVPIGDGIGIGSRIE